MLTKLVVTVTGPDFAALQRQVQLAETVGDVVEYRVDLFQAISPEQLKSLKQQSRLPVLLTLRSRRQGGAFSDDPVERKTYLHHLSAVRPEILDVEWGTPRADMVEWRRLFPHMRLLLSFHDFESPPRDLHALLHDMLQYPASDYKIVVQANEPADALRVMRFVKHANVSGARLSGMCMGEAGPISRALAGVVGCPLVFGHGEESAPVVPGQLSAKTLRSEYSPSRQGINTALLGLVGYPIDGSLSDRIHNRVLGLLDLPGVYVKMPTRMDQLANLLDEARALRWRGLSVTMPLKQMILPFIDELDPAAKAIGAVNTVVFDGAKAHGYNFDGVAALDALQAARAIQLNGLHMVLVGAGGAGRAIAWEAKQRGMRVTLLNRTEARAQHIAEEFGVQSAPLARLPDLLAQKPSILVNATSVGHAANADLLPLDQLHSETLVFDAVHRLDTALLASARSRGCITVSGREMWWRQAQRQIAVWFGSVRQPQEISRALQQALEEIG